MFIWYLKIENNIIKESVHKLLYKCLSKAEREKIEAYLSVRFRPAEIAYHLDINHSTSTHEINCGAVKKWTDGLTPEIIKRFYPKPL